MAYEKQHISVSNGTIEARTISFGNSNNVSFYSTNGSLVASINAAGGGLTNINLSAGTTSNNLSNVVFSNSNGVSFGLNGSTMTASVNAGAGVIATEVYDVWSAGSTGTVTRYAPEDHKHAGVGAIAAGSTNGNTAGNTMSKHGTWIVAGSGSLTVSGSTAAGGNHVAWIQHPNWITTARASNDAIGLNTAQTNVTWTVNSAGLSLNAEGYAGTGTTFNGANISASITQNSNGINISASVAAPGGGAQVSTYNHPQDNVLTTVGAPINNSASVVYMQLPIGISATQLKILGSVNVATIGNTSSAALLYTLSAVILTRNANTLNSLSSATTAATINWQSNSTGSVTGARFFSVPINVNATAGDYFVALQLSTRATGHSGASTTSLGNTITMFGVGSAILGAFTAAEFGAVTASSSGHFIQGINSSTGNITQISLSNISVVGTFMNRAAIGLRFQA